MDGALFVGILVLVVRQAESERLPDATRVASIGTQNGHLDLCVTHFDYSLLK